MNTSNHLGLFAKFWQPGGVKTRLAKVLGNQLASQVYLEFLSHLVDQLRSVADHRSVVYSPIGRKREFSQLCGAPWDLTPQSDGDIGNRMQRFFENGFTRDGKLHGPKSDTQKIVVIGSDCPTLDSGLIHDAFQRLDRQPIVIGPSSDGGYYLIGIAASFVESPNSIRSIFEHVDWSTSRVLPQTIQRLTEQNTSFELLPERTDIDQWSDLKHLLQGTTIEKSETPGSNESVTTPADGLIARLQTLLADVDLDRADQPLSSPS